MIPNWGLFLSIPAFALLLLSISWWVDRGATPDSYESQALLRMLDEARN